jgi:hypothetical protein
MGVVEIPVEVGAALARWGAAPGLGGEGRLEEKLGLGAWGDDPEAGRHYYELEWH